jgi:hypothetical protein
MKQLKITTILFSALSLSLAGCLKEASMNNDPSKANNVIEFINTGGNQEEATSYYPGYYEDLGSLATGASAKFNLNVGYGGGDNAPEDITVNLSLDQAALDQYNTENGTSLVMPPTDVYNLPSSVVIKKGTKMGQALVTITNASSYDFNAAYALPIKITSASKGTVSSNLGKAVYSFGVRNIYDGHYKIDASSSLVDLVAPSNSSSDANGPYPYEVDLVTTGKSSVKMHTSDGDVHYIANNNWYGEFDPVFTFDLATNNIISVGNWLSSPTKHRSAQIDPAGANKQNADKSIDVQYDMYQNGSLRTTFNEHLIYIGPRQ